MTLSAAPLPSKASYRHIVFADTFRDRRRPVNFGPEQSDPRNVPREGVISTHERSFINWLFEQTGLRARQYRPETLVRRLPAAMRLLRAGSLPEARNFIEANPSLAPLAIDALVIGVTSFFRDPAVFQTLRDNLLPQLMERKRSVRIWSVGCSDGQELYSVMMLLAELGWLNRSDLLGTDCRTPAVRRAAAGIYSDTEVQSIPRALLERYFARTDGGWRIDSRFRTVVQWRTADVLQMSEPGTWDLILCRNCVMYFEPDPAAALWEQFHRVLRPGALLVTGKAERPTVSCFKPLAPCIFRRQ